MLPPVTVLLHITPQQSNINIIIIHTTVYPRVLLYYPSYKLSRHMALCTIRTCTTFFMSHVSRRHTVAYYNHSFTSDRSHVLFIKLTMEWHSDLYSICYYRHRVAKAA